MLSNPRTRKALLRALAISTIILILIVGTQFALANRTANPSAQKLLSNSPNIADDNSYEVGVEWVNDFPFTSLDLVTKDDACEGLFTTLKNSQWFGTFDFGDSLAKARDFESLMWGGTENYFVDRVDIVMLCSRGAVSESTSKIMFNLNNNFDYLIPGKAVQSYGDGDLEWLALEASTVLTDTSSSLWANTMKGLHLLLGYKTGNLTAGSEGEIWAKYMLGDDLCPPPATITQSWFHMVDDLQPAISCARVLAERDDSFNDYLWGQGSVSSDFPVDNLYSSLDHCSTGPASKELLSSYDQPEVLAMPIVRVVDRVVNMDYVLNTIAPAFNLQDEDPCETDDKYAISTFASGITLTLLVDQETGAFSFQNLSSLWIRPVITPTLPSEGVAAGLIDNWFRTTPAMNLPGAGYRNAGHEYMTEDFIGNIQKLGSNESLQAQQVSVLPANISMTYPRILTVASRTTEGIQQVNYPVLGPGGRMKIYLGNGGEIIGAQGGSRDVNVMGDMVDTLDPNVVWLMFLDNPQLSIGEIDITADVITHTVPTLGYYEMPYIVHQHDLIPVWEFRAYFYFEGNLVARDVPIYLPAAQYYLPPQVSILNPPSGSTFWSGEPITFNGSITGGTPPYTIEWESSKDGFLGNTLNIVANLTTPSRDGSIFTQTVSLNVTDANGLTSTATVSLKIKPLFWLPAIYK